MADIAASVLSPLTGQAQQLVEAKQAATAGRSQVKLNKSEQLAVPEAQT
jgi:hypothetical protein